MTADRITADEPLGQDGQRLHAWADEGDAVERVPNPVSSIGALIAGRRTYETSLPWWEQAVRIRRSRCSTSRTERRSRHRRTACTRSSAGLKLKDEPPLVRA
jgi:hypothetical protein